MGYSSRYHAASLAAVFVALAVGILIGAALGSDVITGTAENLEENLGEDLDALRAENAELQDALEAERALQERTYPAVVGRRLRDMDVALVGLGSVDTEALTGDVEAAVGPAGASVAEVAVVAEPPDVGALIGAVREGAARTLPRGEALRIVARQAGARLVGEGDLGQIRQALLQSYSGDPRGVDAVVLARAGVDDLSPREQADTEVLEDGLVAGMRRQGVPIVGVERSDTDPSQVPFFEEHGLASVDNVDAVAGRIALVLALDGAEGSFGTKETADSLLPDLLPPRGAPPG